MYSGGRFFLDRIWCISQFIFIVLTDLSSDRIALGLKFTALPNSNHSYCLLSASLSLLQLPVNSFQVLFKIGNLFLAVPYFHLVLSIINDYDLHGSRGKTPVEDSNTYFFRLNQIVGHETFEDLFDSGERDSCFDRKFLNFIILEDRLL